MDRVANKVAIVTGGAVGIGHTSCMLLAEQGAKVAVTDVQDGPGRATVEAIRKAGGTADYWRLDVSSEREVQQAMADIAKRFGAIHVLVNNAGISGVNKPTHEVTEAEWDRLMSINVKGVFFCTKHVIPHMRAAGGGSIINMSSIYGIVGAGDAPPYHASKGAVRLMSKNDAITYATDKIRVNSIHPGFIWTPMVEKFAAEQTGGVDAVRKALDAKHPLGHVGKPEDVAWGVVYLASDESAFVTGSELVIDGGYTAQ